MGDLVRRLRECAECKDSEAWRRPDGGQDLCIGSMLANDAADRIEALEDEVARLRKIEATYDTVVKITAMESREADALTVAQGTLAGDLAASLEALTAERAGADAAQEKVGMARLLVDTGACLMGETWEYRPKVVRAILGHLDAALSAHDARRKGGV